MWQACISIIIPVYNGANYLREAIDSALSQTWPQCEVLVINDGSTDSGATEAIAHSYGERIRYFRKPNGGVASALNLGIGEMRGEFFCWLSHDDVFLPEHVETLAAGLPAPHAPAVVYGDAAVIDAEGTDLQDMRAPDLDLSFPFCHVWGWSFLNGCAMLIPRQVLVDAGCFREDLSTTQDHELWLRLVRRVPFRHVPHIVTLSRRHAEQGSCAEAHRRECVRLFSATVPELLESCRGAGAADLASAAPLLARAIWRRIGDYGSGCGIALAKAFARHASAEERRILVRALLADLPQGLGRCLWLKVPGRCRSRLRLRTRTCIGIRDKCRRIYKTGGGRALWKRSARYARRLLRRCCRCFLATRLPRSAPEELRRAETFLILDHDAGGGANAFREQMARRLLNEGRALLVWQYLGGVGRYLLEWRFGEKCARYRAKRLEECLDFLRSLAPETLFLNSIVGWPRIEDTLDGIAALGANSRLEVFLHDFFAVCPAYPLLDKSGRFCGVPEDLNLCGRCLPGHSCAAPHTSPDVRAWRRVWQRFLLQAHTITMADTSARKLVARVYPAITERIAVKPLAPLRHWQPLPAPLPAEAGEMTVIGVVGNISRHKGAAIVEDLARLVDERKLPLAITVIGELESSMRHPRLKVTGTYAHDRLPELLRRWKVAVCLVPSPLPETFCYAAQEVEMLGLPLVCLDLGAQGQRARRYARGHVAPSPDAVGCLAAILAALELPGGARDAAVEERGFQC